LLAVRFVRRPLLFWSDVARWTSATELLLLWIDLSVPQQGTAAQG